MLKLIGSILFVYYLILGVAALIFLAWGYIDDHRQAKRRKRNVPASGTDNDPRTHRGQEPEYEQPQEAKLTGGDPNNVVRFKRDK